jgi:hypothetical protein
MIKVVRCPVCHNRRRCTVIEGENWVYWKCSKAHRWQYKLPHIYKMDRIFKDVWEDVIVELVNNKNPLCEAFRGEKGDRQ